jgi:PncC family amidohydrolase
MERLITQIHRVLLRNRFTVAAAESCTGGILSGMLTSISGSSGYFKLGMVVYSNETKKNILKIPEKLIADRGAVSKEVAALMAERIRKLGKTTFGIGITGIAGPTGGTPRKPVGTVFIAVNSVNKSVCRKFNFTGSRSSIRRQAATAALRMLKTLLPHPTPHTQHPAV